MLLVTSTTRKHYALFMGTIVQLTSARTMLLHANIHFYCTECTVTMTLDRRPRGNIRTDNFRLDRYQSVTAFGVQMSNITRLMMDTDYR